MMKQKPIKCPYCHANASLRPASVVYGLNRRSQGKFLYLCDRWPACDAYVSAHDKTHRPMGTLANGDLRHKRILAHRALEQSASAAQMSTLADANKSVEEAAKAENSNTEDTATKNNTDKSEKTQESAGAAAEETDSVKNTDIKGETQVTYTPIDIRL